MSTHVFFAFFFPHIRLMQPDGGSLEPDATADVYYYMEAAEDQE